MKRFLAALLAAAVFLLPCSCKKEEDKPEGKLFRYYIEAEPVTLDPQTASDQPSLLAIENLFEGLARLDENNHPIPGAAESWESDSGQTVFTFHLREGLTWSDGTPLTASDFVYGMQRAVNPATRSPSWEQLSCIRNAEQIHNGQMEVAALGVSAPDDRTVVIELEYAYPSFPALTANAAYMPCKQDFFTETRGKYGLESDAVLGNGPFMLREKSGWVHDKYVRLVANENYQGEQPAAPSGVMLTVSKQPENVTEAILGDVIDAAPLPGEQVEQAESAGLPLVQFADTTWGVLFNTQKKGLADANVRRAFLFALNRETVLTVTPPHLISTGDLIPPENTFLGDSYREQAGALSLPTYDTQQAVLSLAQGLEAQGLKELPTLTILCQDTFEMKSLANNLAATWRDGLKYYLAIEPVSAEELVKRVAAGDYQIAVASLTSPSADPRDFLSLFSSTAAGNPAKYQSEDYDALLNAAAAAQPQEELSLIKQAETMLVEDGVFYPLYNENHYYVTGPTVTGLIIRPFSGVVDFSHAGKLNLDD